MNCGDARKLAAKHGFSDKDVKKSYQTVYSYKSPVDNANYSATKPISASQIERHKKRYKKGEKFKIYAHLEIPKQNRW